MEQSKKAEKAIIKKRAVAMKKQVLRVNALQAWTMAITNCNEIMSGKVALQFKKQFVSSLHNAVELFLKQYMINTNKYEILDLRKVQQSDPMVQSYNNASDLNDFIDVNEKWCSAKQTITFSKIIKQYRVWSLTEKALQHHDFTKEFKLLNRLRNQETHFFIKNSYLKDTEFEILYNFMIDFYQFLLKGELLPFFGEALGKYERLAFNRHKLSGFTYSKVLHDSKYVQKLSESLRKKEFLGPVRDCFDIAQTIVSQSDEQYDEYELWTYIELLQNYGMLSWVERVEEFDADEFDIPPNIWLRFIIN